MDGRGRVCTCTSDDIPVSSTESGCGGSRCCRPEEVTTGVEGGTVDAEGITMDAEEAPAGVEGPGTAWSPWG